MTAPEIRALREAGTRTATVATGRRDGRPRVVPGWFVLEREDAVFTTGERSSQGEARRRDPRRSVCGDDDRPLHSYVAIRGRASVSADLDELLRCATRVGRDRGTDRAEELGRRNALAAELLVRVQAIDVIAAADVAA